MQSRLGYPDLGRLHSFGGFLHAPAYDEKFVGVSWSGLAENPSAIELHYAVDLMPARYCSVVTVKATSGHKFPSFPDYITQQIGNERLRRASFSDEIEELFLLPSAEQVEMDVGRHLRQGHLLVNGERRKTHELSIDEVQFIHFEDIEHVFYLSGTAAFLATDFKFETSLDAMTGNTH